MNDDRLKVRSPPVQHDAKLAQAGYAGGTTDSGDVDERRLGWRVLYVMRAMARGCGRPVRALDRSRTR